MNGLNKRFRCLLLGVAICIFSSCAFAGENYARINNLNFYYEDTGSGPIIVFAPGWTFSSRVFENQIEFFAREFRVIAYDPRSQGRSSITLDGNTYSQHGSDLKVLLEHIGAEKFFFVGWSAGCFDGYDYVRRQGTSKIAGFVCIDQSPMVFGKTTSDWAIGNWDGWKSLVDGTAENQIATAQWLAQWMTVRELDSNEIGFFTNQSLQTPAFAGVNLLASMAFSDYTVEASEIDSEVPFLNIVRADMEQQARQWLNIHAPNSRLYVNGRHAMFWEFPDATNSAISKFLRQAQIGR